jgi:drug/metabolite transporter (DMT)-like permease
MFENISNQTKGTFYCAFGVLCLSPDSLMLRKVSTLPNDTVTFYRFFFFTTTILIYFIIQTREKFFEKFEELGKIGLAAGIIWGVSNIFGTMALQKTAVASALVILASNPMFSAIFSYFILKESIPYRTIIAALVCFGAICIIFSSELGSGSSNAEGVMYALGAAVTMGLYFVLLRMASIHTGLVSVYIGVYVYYLCCVSCIHAMLLYEIHF